MPIEFRCTECGRLLRTPDDTAGKQAQCPACGTLSTIPPPAAFAEATPPLLPLGTDASVSPGPAPDRSVDAGPETAAAAGAERLFQTPGPTAYLMPAAQRVSAPATALMVTAILALIVQALGIILNLVVLAVPRFAVAVTQRHGGLPFVIGSGYQLIPAVFGVAVSIFILIGAIKMKNLESHSFALASAIVAMIPCISPCCLLGLPFGIWALVVLNDSSVRAAFRR